MAEKEQINLFALSLEQLNSLKQSIEEELQGLQGAIQQLQVSRNKLANSKEALSRLSQTPEGTELLVPITSSLYVPGETTSLETVIVDVGTGESLSACLAGAALSLSRSLSAWPRACAPCAWPRCLAVAPGRGEGMASCRGRPLARGAEPRTRVHVFVVGTSVACATSAESSSSSSSINRALTRPCALLSPSLSLSRAGYFIEKTVDEAKAFLERKMALIENQAQNVQAAAQYKRQNLQGTVDVMNRKIMEMRDGAGSSSDGGGTAV
jgi:prefoldin alpha subunit